MWVAILDVSVDSSQLEGLRRERCRQERRHTTHIFSNRNRKSVGVQMGRVIANDALAQEHRVVGI